MKKFLLALSIGLAGCFGTDPEEPKNENPKVVVIRSITKNDTTINKIPTMNIVGSVGKKSNTGETVGGMSAVVCLENFGKCVKTNKNGQYAFQKTKTSSIAGRMFIENDTTQTPDIVDTIPDTTIEKKTQLEIDTIKNGDTTVITEITTVNNIVNVESDSVFVDTVSVYVNSKILYEVPVKTWRIILPPNYIVQRNISGRIYSNKYSNEIKKVEAVFWGNDSVALVIPLELNGLNYSGFVYQLYDDSSFQHKIKNKNIFVRVLDESDTVFGMTNVVTYSEVHGDLNQFDTLVPGSIIKYPKPSFFVAIGDGTNIKKIVTNTELIDPKYFGDFDSLSIKPQYTKTDTIVTNDPKRIEINYQIDPYFIRDMNTNFVDSIGLEFNSDKVIEDLVVQLDYDIQIVKADSGKNVVKTKWNDTNLKKNGFIRFTIGSCDVTDVRMKVWLKKP